MSRTFASTSLSHGACGTRLPGVAINHDVSPLGWSQIWSHLLASAANHSEIITSRALRGLPWAQGAAGSNPVAPTNRSLSFASGRRDRFGHLPTRGVPPLVGNRNE